MGSSPTNGGQLKRTLDTIWFVSRLGAVIWIFAVLLVISVTAIIRSWPSWLELPWLGFTDFVMTDEKVLVYLMDFDRVVSYSFDGSFLESLPAPRGGRGLGRLAVTEDRHVFVRLQDRLYRYSSDWTLEGQWETDFDGPRAWRLGPSGEPIALKDASSESVAPDRPVREGELLFSPDGRFDRRSRFRNSQGVEAARSRRRLTIHTQAAEPISIGTPWYFRWLPPL